MYTIFSNYCPLIARHFLTRALLATSNVDDAFRVLADAGVGAADACSINLSFIS